MRRERPVFGPGTAYSTRAGCVAAFGLLLTFLCLLGRPARAASPDLRLVGVKGVVADQSSGQPVVLLEEKASGVLLPIWIGPAEAQAILMALGKAAPPRPMTHDLMRSIIGGLKARVLRVVITELRGGTYFAFIEMRAAGGRLSVDSRPSDAIALALRVKSPIYVKPDVMKAGVPAAREYAHRRKLGVVLQRMTPALARFFGGEAGRGLLVSQVREGAPAAHAGLRRGDVILEAGGRAVGTVGVFESVFLAHPSGVEVSVRRDGEGAPRRLKLKAAE